MSTQKKDPNVIKKSETEFYNALAQRESTNRHWIKNDLGYAGLFQMGEAALTDAHYYKGDTTSKNDWVGKWDEKHTKIGSIKEFLSNPEEQKAAIKSYHKRVWKSYLKGYHEYEGREIAGVTLTKSGMIAAAHLVGHSAFKKFIRSDGEIIPKDGNKVPCTSYLKEFGGYEMGPDFPTVLKGQHRAPHKKSDHKETAKPNNIPPMHIITKKPEMRIINGKELLFNIQEFIKHTKLAPAFLEPQIFPKQKKSKDYNKSFFDIKQ